MTRSATLCTLAMVLLALPLSAQTPTGAIQGTIEDATGAVIPGAKVEITNVRTNERRVLASGVSGRYVQLFLLPGTYSVRVEKEGFRPGLVEDIKLDVNQNRSVDFRLELGQVTAAIKVEAAPPVVDVNTSTVGAVVENKRIIDLPLNGRSAFSLAGLAPGVNPTGGGATPHMSGSQTSTSEVQIDGATNVGPGAIGGMNRRIYEPQVDAVEEFSVQINGLAAEYGRFAGGVINVATKSGTNQFHGTAYNFLRNSKLDATNFFVNRAGRKKSDFKRNQYGGTVGGPVLIPRLYNGRDKTFFFAGYEGTNARSQAVYTTTVPIAPWKTGDFSNLRTAAGQSIIIHDPLTGRVDPLSPTRFIRDPMQGNRIPASRMDPVAVNVLKYFPEPNATPVNPNTQGSNYVGNGVTPNDTWRLDTRIDHNWSADWRTFVRVATGGFQNTQFNPFGNIAMPTDGGGVTEQTNTSATMDNVVTLSPTLLINFRYGIGRWVNDRMPFGAGFDLTTLGLPAYMNETASRDLRQFPKFSFAGMVTDLGQANTRAFEASTAHNVLASLSNVRPRHSLKFGFEYRKMYNNYSQFASPAGQWSFAQNWTQQEIATPSATAGSPLASFLLGLPNGGSASHAWAPATSASYLALYAQDDWKLTRRLTLNLGLRYEIQFPRTERFDRLSVFDLYAPSPIAGKVPANACLNCGNLLGAMRYAGADNRKQFSPIYTDFGPRAGLSFALTPQTVIRMGYGIMYPPSSLTVGGTSFGAAGFAGGTSGIYTRDSFRTVETYLRNPFPNGFNFPPGKEGGAATNLGLGPGDSVYDRIISSYVQQWNFNLQRSLPGSITVEAGYIGSRGVHLIDGDSGGDAGEPRSQLHPSFMALGPELLRIVPNPFFGVITNPTSTLSGRNIEYRQTLRPYPHYQDVAIHRRPQANSVYHAFTLRAEKRFSRGISFLASFTGGKSIDDGSAVAWWEGPTSRSFLDAYNRRLERSVSSWDVSRRLVLSYIYELPFGKGKPLLAALPRGLNMVVSGWQFNGITTLQTGTPLVIGVPQNNTFIYTRSQRPNNDGRSARIEGGTTDERLARWYDTSVFSQPPSYTLGNNGRTLPDVRTPGTNTHDLSFFKNNYFGPEGRWNVQYRLEMFSALNHAQFGGPATLVGSPSVGTITGAGGSRQIQMALKLLW